MSKTVSDIQVLREKALKVKLQRSKLARNTSDRDLSKLLTDMKHVKTNGQIRVQKTMFTKDITDPYMKVISESGKYFYRMTTPWDDKGFRLLGIKNYKAFTKKMKEFKREFRTAVDLFIDGIASDMVKMKDSLQDAYNHEDYKHLFLADGVTLDRELIMGKFNLDVEYDKVSSADTNDLRASLTEDDRAILSDEIEKSHIEKFGKTQEHLTQCLYNSIESLHERLADTDNVFRDTLVENLVELCDLMPKMNISGDPVLNDLAAKAKKELCGWGPQDLRDDVVKRKAVSKKADNMLGNMKGMI